MQVSATMASMETPSSRVGPEEGASTSTRAGVPAFAALLKAAVGQPGSGADGATGDRSDAPASSHPGDPEPVDDMATGLIAPPTAAILLSTAALSPTVAAAASAAAGGPVSQIQSVSEVSMKTGPGSAPGVAPAPTGPAAVASQPAGADRPMDPSPVPAPGVEAAAVRAEPAMEAEAAPIGKAALPGIGSTPAGAKPESSEDGHPPLLQDTRTQALPEAEAKPSAPGRYTLPGPASSASGGSGASGSGAGFGAGGQVGSQPGHRSDSVEWKTAPGAAEASTQPPGPASALAGHPLPQGRHAATAMPSVAAGEPLWRSTGGPSEAPVAAASTATAPEQAGAPPEDPLGQLLSHAARLAFPRNSRLRVQLKPASLGTLDLNLVLKDDALTLRILADSPRTRDLLQSSLPQLREALAQRGLEVAHLSLAMTDGRERPPDGWAGASAFSGFDGRQAAAEQQLSPRRHRFPEQEPGADPAQTHRAVDSRGGHHLVDCRV